VQSFSLDRHALVSATRISVTTMAKARGEELLFRKRAGHSVKILQEIVDASREILPAHSLIGP